MYARHLSAAAVLCLVVATGACNSAAGPANDGGDVSADGGTGADSASRSDAEGPDLFRLAINGAPTGSFLSVWGSSRFSRMFVAGGFVGVDPARLPAGTVGRLLEYSTGSFRTVCQTDQVLWWTVGVLDAAGSAEVIYAAGEGGRIVRVRNGMCETLALNVTYPQGPPTFWGIYGRDDNDLWFVGGSARPDGPRGVLVHFDGTTFSQEIDLPAEATGRNLYKIDGGVDGRLFVVGEAGLVLVRDPRTRTWTRVTTDLGGSDNRLFTISCPRSAPYVCWAVGGMGVGRVLSGNVGGFSTAPYFSDLGGLSGVWVQDPRNVWAVGNDGLTLHFDGHVNGRINYHPATPLTQATLHGVGGSNGVILAVGGELGSPTPDQRGVILVRGDDSERFLLDGQSYMASGTLRRSIGGFNQ